MSIQIRADVVNGRRATRHSSGAHSQALASTAPSGTAVAPLTASQRRRKRSGALNAGSITASVSAVAGTGARLELTPASGEFINYDVDTTYVLAFTIRNRTPEMQTLRVIPPLKCNTAFRVVNTDSVNIAAGLSHTIDIEFTTHTQDDYEDFFTLLNANGERFEVPLIAKSVPELKFATTLDFGRVEHTCVGLSKALALINRGRKDAQVSITTKYDSILSINPPNTVARASGETIVNVELAHPPMGVHQWPILVSVEGEPMQREVMVCADVVDCRSKLLDPRTGTEALSVTFDTAYAGTKKTYELTVLNGSESAASFAFQLANELVAKDAPPFRFVPEQGRLGPKEAKKVMVVFEPPLNPLRKGWTCQQQEQSPTTRKFEGLFSLMFVETEQTHGFHVSGESTDTAAWLSHSVLDFGACGLNDYRNLCVEVHNGVHDLPLHYAFDHVANFRFSKPSGMIPPGGSCELEVTFQPRRLGNFNDKVVATFNKTVQRSLVLTGHSMPSTTKKAMCGGKDALPEDFKRKSQPPTHARPRSPTGHSAEEAGIIGGPKYVAAIDLPKEVDLGMVPAAGLKPPQPSSTSRLMQRELLAEDSALHAMTSAHVAPTAFDVKALIKRRYAEAPTNAMERRDCRRELMPMDLLKVVLPIKLVQFGRVTVFSQAVRSFYVFNGTNTCIVATMPSEEPHVSFVPQSQVIPANRMAQFDVCLCSPIIQSSQLVIQFLLNNRHHMRFTLQAEVVPVEVSLSQYEAVLNFSEFTEEPVTRLALTMSNDGNSEAPFHWKLPDKVSFSITPISGILAPQSKQVAEVTFIPPQGALDVACDALLSVEGASEDKKLRLIGVVAPTRCVWGKGMIAATSSGVGGVSGATGGGSIFNPGTDAQLDLHRIAAGRSNTHHISLVNRGTNNAFYSFDSLPEWLRVTPSRGRICSGEIEELTLTVKLNREEVLHHAVLCNVRGMRKPLRLVLSATVAAPSICVVAPEKVKGEVELDFGQVYVNSEAIRSLTFKNTSDVPAVVNVDLRGIPDFFVQRSRRAITSSNSTAPAEGAGEAAGASIGAVGFDSTFFRAAAEHACDAEDDVQCIVDSEEDEAVAYNSGHDTPRLQLTVTGQAQQQQKSKQAQHQPHSPTGHRDIDSMVLGGIGRMYAVTVRAEGETTIDIGYAPHSVGKSDCYSVRWYQVGADEMHPLPPLSLTAESLAPLLSLSANGLNFPQVVAHQPPKPQTVTVRNMSSKEVNWCLETPAGRQCSAVEGKPQFLVEPSNGTLASDGSQKVTITFLASAVGIFGVTYELLCNGDNAKPCGRLTAEAKAVKPRILCDRRAVLFPPVPLGVEVRETVYVINEGFECINLQYDGECQPPITVGFPVGTVLSTAVRRVPIEITFCSTKPVTLSSSIVLGTNLGERVTIAVAATAINSVLTTQGVLRFKDTQYKIQASSTLTMTEPFMLVGPKPGSSGRGGGTQQLSAVTTDQHQLQQQQQRYGSSVPVMTYGLIDTVNRPWYHRGAQECLTRWCNANVLRTPVANVVDALQHTHGGVIYDMVERLFGKRPKAMSKEPEQKRKGSVSQRGGGLTTRRRSKSGAGSSVVSSSAASPRVSSPRVLSPSRKVASQNKSVTMLETLVSFLKAYGCCLSGIQLRYLLPYEEYMEYIASAHAASDETDGAAARTSSKYTNMSRPRVGSGTRDDKESGDEDAGRSFTAVSEHFFHARAMHAWLTLLLETIRVFYLSRLKLSVVLKQPLIERAVPIDQWTTRSFADCLDRSNVYSAEESLLLQWLRGNLVKYAEREGLSMTSPVTSPMGGGGITGSAFSGSGATSVFAPHRMRLESFEDCRDVRVFIAAVLVYVPALRPHFFHNDRHVIAKPSTLLEHEHNAQVLLSALVTLGALHLPSTRELLEMNQVDFVLFAAFLFSYLPRFLSASTIHFKGKLLSAITQTVEVVNGLPTTRTYRVHLDSASDFELSHREFTVAPGTTFALTLSVTPKFHRSIAGQCLIIDHSAILPEERAPLVCDLLVTPTAEPTRVITLETPLYEPLYTEIEVQSPFQKDCVASLRVSQEFSPRVIPRPAPPGSSSADGAEETVEATSEYPEAQFAKDFKNAFFVTTDVLPLRRGETAVVPVQFVPLSRGRYTVTLTFHEEKEGEFSYQIVGTCVEPRPSEMSSEFRAELDEECHPSVSLRTNNLHLERAVRTFDEKSRQLNGGAGPRGGRPLPNMTSNRYRVDFLNEDMQGPNPFYQMAAESNGFFELAEDANVSTLRFQFKPKYVGTYRALIMLSSSIDVRFIHIVGECVPKGEHRVLRFCCPARQSITQDIVINNFSAQDWLLTAIVEGEGFSGLRELRAPKGKHKEYSLKYSPAWIAEELKGKLMLLNNTTGQRFTYTLIGNTEPPLCEDVLHISCRAREKETMALSVPNVASNDTTYFVETDLPFTKGESSLVIPRPSLGKYTLDVTPTVGGTYSGKIVFRSNQGRYVWYVVNLTVTPPEKEGTILLATDVRTTVVADVKFTNPLDRSLTFIVKRCGAGLYGDNYFHAAPGETITYSCTFVPANVGTTEGRLSFCNDEIGEFWYELKMTMEDSTPEELKLVSTLGVPTSAHVKLPNMTERECALTVQNTNPANFTVSPAIVLLGPNSETLVELTYTPTAVGTPQRAVVTLSHPQLGHWKYHCEGTGTSPPVPAAPLVSCVCEMGSGTTVAIPFTNTLDVNTNFIIVLQDNAEGFFTLKKAPQGALQAGASTQLLIAYAPKSVGRHTTMVEVRAELGATNPAYAVTWCYPVEGRAEWRESATPFRFRCAARKQHQEVILLRAPGLTLQERTGATISFAPDARQHYLSAIKASFTCELTAEGDKFPDVFQAQICFGPLRPLAASGDLLVTGAKGGIWRYRVFLEATPATPDDTIRLACAYNSETAVVFDLYNAFPYKSKFAAYFTSDSSKDFAVAPAQGVLLPFVSGQRTGAAATPIKIAFRPTSRVPQVEGALVVDTEDMQWSFRVIGRLESHGRPIAK